MTLKRVRLERARDSEFPEGSPNHGYEFNLALLDDGRVDLEALPELAQLCTVVHFEGEDEAEHGQIVALPGGQWAFSYAPGEDDDEPIFHLADRAFREGEYLSVTGHDGKARTYHIVSIDPVPHASAARRQT